MNENENKNKVMNSKNNDFLDRLLQKHISAIYLRPFTISIITKYKGSSFNGFRIASDIYEPVA